MSKLNFENTFGLKTYGVPVNIYLAVKQVENAIRLFAYDHLKKLQFDGSFSSLPNILSEMSIDMVLSMEKIEDDFDAYYVIYNRLMIFEKNLVSSLKNADLIEEGIWVLFEIYRALQELDKLDVPIKPKIRDLEESFEKYIENISKKLLK
ncbi:hypothetical protein [Solibacillus merdavium]|uniref:Uncharacterized protein n=1 Tax=Solibacillus merdavium TaxID=2762218 RepID=A0ABR8XRM5_9BACL|nr:hypothetical protein [Solibacillus merdavium]MBD8034594.1 hypothetical protein [Solibacillus merdavium]